MGSRRENDFGTPPRGLHAKHNGATVAHARAEPDDPPYWIPESIYGLVNKAFYAGKESGGADDTVAVERNPPGAGGEALLGRALKTVRCPLLNNTTLGGGSLGSQVDEGRSEVRELM